MASLSIRSSVTGTLPEHSVRSQTAFPHTHHLSPVRSLLLKGQGCTSGQAVCTFVCLWGLLLDPGMVEAQSTPGVHGSAWWQGLPQVCGRAL